LKNYNNFIKKINEETSVVYKIFLAVSNFQPYAYKERPYYRYAKPSNTRIIVKLFWILNRSWRSSSNNIRNLRQFPLNPSENLFY